MARPSSTFRTVIAYSPAMLDINIESSLSAQQYLLALSAAGIKPGDWAVAQSIIEVEQLSQSIGGQSLSAMVRSRSPSLQIGSTIAGSYAAFNPSYVGSRQLRLVVGRNEANGTDDYGLLLLERLTDYRLPAQAIPWSGTTDLCLAAYHRAVPERAMLVFRGLKRPELPVSLSGDPNALYFISAFELDRGFFRIDPIAIRREQSSVALGLGDVRILERSLAREIHSLLRAEAITYVFGDSAEYRRLFAPFHDTIEFDVLRAVQDFSRHNATTFLLTAGAAGMYGIANGSVHFLAAHNVVALVNTNGAGDAAAGGFLSTHLLSHDIEESLAYAMDRAEEVLRSPSGVLGGRTDAEA